MATFDQLSAEQRAIIELVLRQGKTYAELAEMLGMPEERVRTLARASLAELAPVTSQGVDDDWRGQLADYLLGQQTGPEVTATRGHLRRSEPARSWTRSLLDSLDQLYPDGLPEIPSSDRAGARRREAAGAAGTPLTPEAQAIVRRRRLLAAGAGLVALIALIVLVWPVGILTGGDDSDDGGAQSASSANGEQAQDGKPAGIAVVALRDGKYRLILQAANLPALEQRQAYEVWLYNGRGDAKSVGAQVLDENGAFQGQSQALSRAEIERYRSVDVSLEPVDENRGHAGTSVLRGKLSALRDAEPKPGKPAVVSQAVLTPPRD